MSEYKKLPKWVTPIQNGKPNYHLSKSFTNEYLLLQHLKTCGYEKIRMTVKPDVYNDDNEEIIYCGVNIYKT